MAKTVETYTAGAIIIHNYPETLAPTPSHPHVKTLVFVDPEVIEEMLVRERKLNPRKEQLLKANARRVSLEIDMAGYLEPFAVNINESLGYSLDRVGYSQGFSRATAIVEQYKSNPARSAEMFPNGFPVYIYDTDDLDAHRRLIDDQKQQALSDHAIRRTLWAMLLRGYKPKVVNKANWLLMEPGAKGTDNLKLSDDKYEQAEATENWRDRKRLTEEAVALRIMAFQGQVQQAAVEVRCPGLMATKEFYETGDRPTEGFLTDVDLLPERFKVTDTNSRKLDAIRKKSESCTQDAPGKAYLTKWMELVKNFVEKKTKAPAAKSLSAKKLVIESRGKATGVAAILRFAAQATVKGFEDDGTPITVVITKEDLADEVEAVRTLNRDQVMLDFARSDDVLSKDLTELFGQITARMEKVLEAENARIKAEISAG